MDSATIRSIRSSVCAVGYLTVPITEYVKDPNQPLFRIVGSGFVIRSDLVLTNRHVLEELDKAQRESGFPDEQRLIQFVYPRHGAGFQVGACRIRRTALSVVADWDIGFIEFKPRPEAEFAEAVVPLEFIEGHSADLADEVILLGYPYGDGMLHRNGRVYRWGPVVQHGRVAAIAPFDPNDFPIELLLDVRVAGGMSGCPVIRKSDRKVVGILHSTWESTTALAAPLRQDLIVSWLEQYSAFAEP